MPRNLSAWKDLLIHLGVSLMLILILSQYNRYLAAIAFLVWIFLVIFARDRSRYRLESFREYCDNVVKLGNELMYYAVKNIPHSVIIIDEEGRMQWCNELTKDFSDRLPEQGMYLDEFWEGILKDEVLEPLPEKEKNNLKSGSYTTELVRHDTLEDGTEIKITRYFKVRYRQILAKTDAPDLTVLFIQEVTNHENLKKEYRQSRTVLMYVQVDNYDEIMQGLNEAEKTALMLLVSEELEKWMASLAGFIQRVSNELFLVVVQQYALDKAVDEKFTILDKVRQIVSKNGIPVTLSIGVAVAEKRSEIQSLAELGSQAQERLYTALSRGGDQVALSLDGKIQYFGGRTKAVEKHNRVRARVTANSIREYMEASDEIFVMGHAREDFDAFGAACGVAIMALYLKKNVHLVLSDSLDSIEKILNQFRKDKSETYKNLFLKVSDLTLPITSKKPLLIVVDTHVPYLVAAPILLDRIKKIIVIDHHRKSDNVIKNPALFYHEPSSSSASELVTELLMYFDEKIQIGKLPATALYSGIVVDTKSFVVQTGIRTFDAAAYLRRKGADPVVVRELFMTDYETSVALAQAKYQSEYFEEGLIISSIDKFIPNIQAVAGQAADSLLTIEKVRMTIVLFQMKNKVIGISARSTGNLNVQVIMEKFGGGGHQNVAGAQVKEAEMDELKAAVTEVARNYISETDKEIAAKN